MDRPLPSLPPNRLGKGEWIGIAEALLPRRYAAMIQADDARIRFAGWFNGGPVDSYCGLIVRRPMTRRIYIRLYAMRDGRAWVYQAAASILGFDWQRYINGTCELPGAAARLKRRRQCEKD